MGETPPNSPTAILAEAERELGMGAPAAALAHCERLLAVFPADPHLHALAAFAAAELEEWDRAARAIAALDSLTGDATDAGHLRGAEVALAAARPREALERLAAAAPENLVASGLRATLACFCPECAAPAQATTPRAGPDGGLALGPALWYPPVLTAVLSFLEERCEAAASRGETLHRARTRIFRPSPETYVLRDPVPGPLGRFLGLARRRSTRERLAREAEVTGALWKGELPGATTSLRAWLDEQPERTTSGDARAEFLIELLFALGNFEGVIEAAERLACVTADAPACLTDLLVAYSHLAQGRAERGLAVLTRPPDPESFGAGGAHLQGLCELALGHRARAVAWFRRAVQRDDIAVVELVRAECEALDVTLG